MKRLFLLFILFLTACEKDANIDLKQAPPMPVIEGRLTDFAPDSYFKITMSKGFERHTYEYPPITDAEVRAKDSQGHIIQFNVDNEGVYRTMQNAVPGETYTLLVDKDQHHVKAVSKMPAAIELTDFDFVETQDPDGDMSTRLKIFFDDPSPQNDYFMVKIFYKYNQYFEQYGNDYYLNDENYNENGHYIIVPYVYYNSNGLYKIKVFHIHKSYIDYLNTLRQLQEMGYGSTPFDIGVPGNPNTNVQNGIGYFATMSSDSLVKNISIN